MKRNQIVFSVEHNWHCFITPVFGIEIADTGVEFMFGIFFWAFLIKVEEY